MDEYNALVASCTIGSRLREKIAARKDVENVEWSGEDEKEYARLCKEFDALSAPPKAKIGVK